MKNLKKISRENLKSIKGGIRMCPDNGDCGPGWCCVGRGCRLISDASPETYLCNAPENDF